MQDANEGLRFRLAVTGVTGHGQPCRPSAASHANADDGEIAAESLTCAGGGAYSTLGCRGRIQSP